LGNLVGGLDESFVGVVVGWVVVQVLLGNVKGLELLNSVVVMGNLWEGEGLLVDVSGDNVDRDLFESFSLGLLSDLHGSLVVLLVKGHAELVHKLAHFFGHLGSFLLLLFLLGFELLLLSESEGGSLLLLFLGNSLLLGFLLGLLFFLLRLDLGLLLSGFLLSQSLLLGGLPLGGLLLSLDGSLLLSGSVLLSLLDLGKLLLLLVVVLLFDELGLLELEGLLGFHLLLDFEHLELSLSLSSGELVLSLESSKVGLGSSLLSSGSLGLLNSLSGKEFLLHSLSLKLLSGLFLLKLLELGSSGSRENLLLLSFLLGHSNFSLKIFVLLDLSLSLLLLEVQLAEKGLLLGILLFFELDESLALNGLSTLRKSTLTLGGTSQGNSLSVSLLGGLLQSFLHGGELLNLISIRWFLNGFDLDDESVASFDIHGRIDLNLLI